MIADDTLKAEITFRGDFIRHKSQQLLRRPVRGEERERLAQSLCSQLPRTLHLERLTDLNEEVHASECLDGVPH